MGQLTRRGFLTATSAAAGAAVVAGCADASSRKNGAGDAGSAGNGEDASGANHAASSALSEAMVAFDGEHQAGMDTEPQAYLKLAGFNLNANVDARDLRNLLRLWTADARAMCTGEPPLGSLEPEMVETPANLTITCGLGPRAFDVLGPKAKKPAWLRDIRPFDRDRLDPQWGQSDVVLQICCDDPLMASHALRHLVRAGVDYAQLSWLQPGFLNAYGALDAGASHRNMFGQVDGTVNPRSDDQWREQVWIDSGEPWARGGAAMVVRRIRMNLDSWEQLDRRSREDAVGRSLATGAPLGKEHELDDADFAATDKYGLPLINPESHMARATAPADHPEQRIKRRPYNYELAPDGAPSDQAGSVQLSNVGQIFICFQKDPSKQFEPIQARLNESDLMNTWITHIGSAVYFVPPGVSSDGSRDSYWAQSLIEAATG